MIADTTISDVTLIISTIGAAVALIIGALATAWVKISAAKKQIDTIEHNTNAELTAQKAKVATQDERIAGLEKALVGKEQRIAEQKVEIAAGKVVAEVVK